MHSTDPRISRPIRVALLWSIAVAPLLAQAPEGEAPAAGFGETIQVEVVNVDVWVTDGKGNPVAGLGPESFEVFHDGRPVPITHFAEVRPGISTATRAVAEGAGAKEASPEGAAPAPRAAVPPSGGSAAEASPGHVVIYFDRSRLHPSHYAALIRSLERFLDAGAVASDRVLILRQDRALSVEAAFGSSRKELGEALDRLAKVTARGLDFETETRLAQEAIREGWEASQDLVGSAVGGLAAVPSTTPQPPGAGPGDGGGGAGPRAVVGGVGSGAGPDACGMFVNQIQPTLDAWTRSNSQRIAVTLTNLSSTVGFLAGLPGVKTLLYLSDGLETRPGADLATYAGSLCPGAGTDLLTGTLSAEMTSGFYDLARHANTNRVTIYSLQTSGLRSPETADASGGRRARGGGSGRARGAFEASKRAGDREGLGLLATETGGRAVFNQNDLGPELVRIGEEMDHYYSLAYEPPVVAGDRRDHRIEVKLADGSLTARYRRGYLEKDSSQWLTERIEGALNLGLTSNPLEVRLGAGEMREAAPGNYRLPLHVFVPAERLAFLPRGDVHLAEILLRVLVRQVDGNTVVTQDQSFRVQGSPGATGFVDLAVELELAGGTHVTAIGVQDANSREASFVSTTLQIGPGG